MPRRGVTVPVPQLRHHADILIAWQLYAHGARKIAAMRVSRWRGVAPQCGAYASSGAHAAAILESGDAEYRPPATRPPRRVTR